MLKMPLEHQEKDISSELLHSVQTIISFSMIFPTEIQAQNWKTFAILAFHGQRPIVSLN